MSKVQSVSRPSGRLPEQIRAVSLEMGVAKHAEGSCLVKFGDTHVLCTASLEARLPAWLRGQGRGWVSAEYGMVPRATGTRMRREASAGKQSGRTQEIQRLIGRSLRAVVDLQKLGEHQISLDCDVLQADGGTRTASITGAWVALHQCVAHMRAHDMLAPSSHKSFALDEVIIDYVAALSCGIYRGLPVADLDYAEDNVADTDGNFVMTGSGAIVEIQATAEGAPFFEDAFARLMQLARDGIADLVALQKQAVSGQD